MNNFKKILLFLFGIVLLIFGNRDVLAKVNKGNDATAKDKDSQTKPAPAIPSSKNDSVTKISVPASTAPKEIEKKTDNNVIEEKAKKKKAKIVIKAEEQEENAQPAPATTIEKEKPEKASSTQ